MSGVKTCPRCSRRRRLKFFSRKGEGYQSWCRDCQREYKAGHYRSNKAAYKEGAKQRKEDLKRRVRELKESTPCADCGERYPYYVMDFDHREGEKKLLTVSRFARSGRERRLFEEIEKCDVVCANCHRVRSYRRQAR